MAQAVHRPDSAGNAGAQSASALSMFTPLGSTSQAHDTIFDGQSFSVAELAYAKSLARELNVPLDAPVLAALLRRHAAGAGVFIVHGEPAPAEDHLEGESVMSVSADYYGGESAREAVTPSPSAPSGETRVPLYKRKEGVRKEIQRAAAKLARLIGVRPFVIYKQWIEMGGAPQGAATEEDLDRKLAYLLDRIREAQQQRR